MTAALIERLEKAEVGSAELSAHLVKAVLAPEDTWVEQSRFNGGWFIYERREKPRLWEVSGPLRGASVTESLDAALALAGRVLPGSTTGHIGAWADGKVAGLIAVGGGPLDLQKSIIGVGKTPALALCIAILKAKAAQS